MPNITKTNRKSRLLRPLAIIANYRLDIHDATPICQKMMPISGANGSSSQAAMISTLHNILTRRQISPTAIKIVRKNAPNTLENDLSRNARNCSGNPPCTTPADICRNGLNKVLNNKPIEKKSAVFNRPTHTCRTCL